MRRPVLAYWYARLPNFGDLLTPFYIRRLTGVEPVNLLHTGRKPRASRYSLAPHSGPEWFRQRFRLSKREQYSCVGSILGRGDWDVSQATVWGSGFLSVPTAPPTRPRRLLCIRGELSLDVYERNVRNEVQALGDPGVLVADFFRCRHVAGSRYRARRTLLAEKPSFFKGSAAAWNEGYRRTARRRAVRGANTGVLSNSLQRYARSDCR